MLKFAYIVLMLVGLAMIVFGIANYPHKSDEEEENNDADYRDDNNKRLESIESILWSILLAIRFVLIITGVMIVLYGLYLSTALSSLMNLTGIKF